MEDLLKTLPYWVHLTDKEKGLVRQEAYIREFEKGEALYEPEGVCIGMIHILSGEVRAYLLSMEGREVTLFHLGSGENCILSASCVLKQITFDSFMRVTQKARILVVPAQVFGQLCEGNVHVSCFSFEVATKRFSSVMFAMQQILFARFDQRLASFLLEEAAKSADGRVHMTQEEIAAHVSSAREVVARMLKRFAEEGLVENRRGEIALLNRKGLQALCTGRKL